MNMNSADLGDSHVAALKAGADGLGRDEVGVGGLQVVQVGVHVLHGVVLRPRHRMVWQIENIFYTPAGISNTFYQVGDSYFHFHNMIS